MLATEFTYPPHSIPLVEAYESRFEAAFVVLHPFVRVPRELAWSAGHKYPSDAEIAEHGSKCAWMEAAAATGLSSCARISQALLTAIGSLPDHLADPFGRDRLQHFLEQQPVWMPTEGNFEQLLRPDFLFTFEAAGASELIYVPEFPSADPLVTLTLDELRTGEAPFPPRGTLLAPDHSFLFTVDWDSFFTLFYGTRAFVSRIAAERGLEGFFVLPTTEHAWFNYSMGCATVTLSPEHWQTKN
ncbi:MAG TPA: DUF2711 family protein [Terracidiphilus sp.]